MPTGTNGRFVWYDLLTPDPDAAVAFYRDVVGWSSKPFPGGDAPYTMFVGAQGPLAGATKPAQAGLPPRWVSNVYVDDVDQTAAKAVELGGRVLAPATDYPTIGRLAVLADPQGAPINIFKPAQPTQLHDATKPGEFIWSELMATDHRAAFAYYGALFGWKKLRDFDMGARGQYLIYGLGGSELGGMFTGAKDAPMPTTWFYYVVVEDLDGALGRARAGGGKVMNGPMEIPGGAHIAQLRDPQGAIFALHENAKPK